MKRGGGHTPQESSLRGREKGPRLSCAREKLVCQLRKAGPLLRKPGGEASAGKHLACCWPLFQFLPTFKAILPLAWEKPLPPPLLFLCSPPPPQPRLTLASDYERSLSPLLLLPPPPFSRSHSEVASAAADDEAQAHLFLHLHFPTMALTPPPPLDRSHSSKTFWPPRL